MGIKPRVEGTATRAGLLIAFEGVDGAGKSTQIRALAGRLEATGHHVVSTREPTDGPWGRAIRASAQTGRMAPTDELAAFVADRRQHVDEILEPALRAGSIVLIDRYYFSTVAYQGARGLDTDEVFAANAFAPAPDVLLLFDIEPRVGLERVRERGLGADLFEKEEELRRVRDIFLSMDFPALVVLDAERAPEVIAAAIWEQLDPVLSRWRSSQKRR